MAPSASQCLRLCRWLAGASLPTAANHVTNKASRSCEEAGGHSLQQEQEQVRLRMQLLLVRPALALRLALQLARLVLRLVLRLVMRPARALRPA